MSNEKTIQEIMVTYRRPEVSTMEKISSSNEAEEVLRKVYLPGRIDHKEFFYIILLTNAGHVLGTSEISSGTTNGTTVNVKEILQLAKRTNASSVILSHNHPSGQLKPSSADIAITKKIEEAGKLVDISVLDHIILTSEAYYSFKDNGQM
jgi:DNA repair protein RadC